MHCAILQFVSACIQRRIGCCNIEDGALCDNSQRLEAVNYYHKALHFGCCSSLRSASGIIGWWWSIKYDMSSLKGQCLGFAILRDTSPYSKSDSANLVSIWPHIRSILPKKLYWQLFLITSHRKGWFWRHLHFFISGMLCAIWYHLHNLKKVKNTHRGVLLLVKLQAYLR